MEREPSPKMSITISFVARRSIFSERSILGMLLLINHHALWMERKRNLQQEATTRSIATYSVLSDHQTVWPCSIGQQFAFLYLVCFVRPSHLVLWSPNKVNIVTYSIAWWPDSSDFFRQINHRKQRHENINSIHGGCSWNCGRGVRQIGRHWLQNEIPEFKHLRYHVGINLKVDSVAARNVLEVRSSFSQASKQASFLPCAWFRLPDASKPTPRTSHLIQQDNIAVDQFLKFVFKQ